MSIYWSNRLLAPVRVLLSRSKVASAERMTQQYLHNVSPSSCLIDLSKALDSLLDGVERADEIFAKFAMIDSSGINRWNKSNFARFFDASLPGNQIMTACVSLLWQIFCFATYFPFSASMLTRNHIPESEESEIDLEGFRRAFALLVLRGFELFGAKKDGSPLSMDVETSYADKVPRLTRIIFGSLSNIKDTVAFTQPITYDSYPHGPSVPEEHFEAAANRLLHSQDPQSTIQGSSYMASKADLQGLIQQLLLIHAEGRHWKAGQFMHEAYQRSGDIQHAHLVSDVEEISRAFKFAAAYVASQFGNSKDSVSWDVFRAWCVSCPPFTFLFFQLWASIFALAATRSSPSRSKSTLPIATANLLLILPIATFKSGSEAKYRFHDNELQFQLDLQSSLLVADLATSSALNSTDLSETLTAKDWFHVLLIWGEDLELKGLAAGRESRLLAAFLSPPEMEMWREEGERLVTYVWHSSVIQFQPALATANSGGMTAHVTSGALELRAHGAEVQQGISIVLNMQERQVDVVGLGAQASEPRGSIGTLQQVVENPGQPTDDARAPETSQVLSKLKMRLTDLKCYRLPGEASKVTGWP